jgi:hypothetical protein
MSLVAASAARRTWAAASPSPATSSIKTPPYSTCRSASSEARPVYEPFSRGQVVIGDTAIVASLDVYDARPQALNGLEEVAT